MADVLAGQMAIADFLSEEVAAPQLRHSLAMYVLQLPPDDLRIVELLRLSYREGMFLPGPAVTGVVRRFGMAGTTLDCDAMLDCLVMYAREEQPITHRVHDGSLQVDASPSETPAFVPVVAEQGEGDTSLLRKALRMLDDLRQENAELARRVCRLQARVEFHEETIRTLHVLRPANTQHADCQETRDDHPVR